MSPRLKSSRPVSSVELKINFRTDSKTADEILAGIPSAVRTRGGCRVIISGETPSEVAVAMKEILGKFRGVVDSPKDFKEPRRATSSN